MTVVAGDGCRTAAGVTGTAMEMQEKGGSHAIARAADAVELDILNRKNNIMNDKKETKPVDLVNQPPHYKESPSGVECIQITEHMNFCLGNAMKYIWRADSKGSPIDDLNKAIWYLKREIERRQRER